MSYKSRLFYLVLVLLQFAIAKKYDIKILVDGTQSLKVISPKVWHPFTNFPLNYVVSNFTIVDGQQPVPANNIIQDQYNYRKGYDISIYTSCYNNTYSLIHLKYVYFGVDSDIYSENGTYYRIDAFSGEPSSKHVSRCFTNVAGITTPVSATFGDLINGLLIRLIHIPAEILRHCVLPTSEGTNVFFIKEILDLIGARGCIVMDINPNELVFAQNLYTFLPNRDFMYLHLAFFGRTADRFGDFCRKGFGVDAKPYDFVLYNRVAGMRRHFTNFGEISSLVREAYPEYNYTTIIGHFGSLRATVRRYGVIKWLFAVAGSNCMNVLFMARRTNVLMFNTKYDEPAIMCALSREIFLVAYTNSSCKQVGEPFALPLHQFRPYLDLSMKILKKGHL